MSQSADLTMLRERVANNIYIFTSELYAQVTAGVIMTSDGAIVIDTLPFPSETRQIVRFVEERHNMLVRYVINTHHHADHTYGTCFFENAQVISHRLCREILDTRGRVALERSRVSSRELASIKLRLPDIIFDEGYANLHLGESSITMWSAPGHSPDSIVCRVDEEGILFAADLMMPLPFFGDGNWNDFVKSLESMLTIQLENVIQGHGEVILRGEVDYKIGQDLDYLHEIRKRVEAIIDQNRGPEALTSIDIEECGKSRIPLNGLVQQLHQSNLETLYAQLMSEREVA